jgi:hypothetical protein
MVCELGQCVPGCAEVGGIQCVGNTACTVSTGRCDQNTTPPPPDPPPPAPGRPGQPGPGQPAPSNPSCPDDAFEDNDSRTDAVSIAAGEHTHLVSCPGDDDYYRVVLTSGASISVQLAFTHADGDVDLQLLNIAGVPVAESVSRADGESLTFTSDRFGLYTIRATLHQDGGAATGNTYAMTVVR